MWYQKLALQLLPGGDGYLGETRRALSFVERGNDVSMYTYLPAGQSAVMVMPL